MIRHHHHKCIADKGTKIKQRNDKRHDKNNGSISTINNSRDLKAKQRNGNRCPVCDIEGEEKGVRKEQGRTRVAIYVRRQKCDVRGAIGVLLEVGVGE